MGTALLLAACAGQYREEYEVDARSKASAACHTAGVNPGDKGYYDCFHSHLDPAMAVAPTRERPVQPRRLTDADICENYGFQIGSAGFATCMEWRDEDRQRANLEIIRLLTPPPVPAYQAPRPFNCTSINVGGGVVRTNCN